MFGLLLLFPFSFRQVGVADLFAQAYALAWWNGRRLEHRDVFVLPRWVQDTRASTVFSAVAEGVPELSVDALILLSQQLPWTLLEEVPDNAAPNKRKLWYTVRLLPSNFLFVPGGCAVHLCSRIAKDSTPRFGKLSLPGDIYAVCFVTHVYSHYDKLSRALETLLERELEWKQQHEVPDDFREECEEHNRALLEHTRMKKSLRTRARLFDVDDALRPGKLEASERERVHGQSLAVPERR